jgi:16S rRNA (cytosine1402-N4)-methyltransferase
VSDDGARHVPVLLAETLELLAPERGGLYVDCTLGLGGHAAALLARAPTARLVGIDRDPEALAIAAPRLQQFGDRVRLVAGTFDRLEDLLDELAVGKVAGILADLGVSSLQLDTPERGFSFRFTGPLDMRMGSGGVSAADIVNHYAEADLEKIFREYGEERDARRIARAVVATRVERPLETTTDLAAVLKRAKRHAHSSFRGHGQREGRVDPSTRAFQALRIEANQELVGLQKLMAGAMARLESDGRLVVISYHSLEDRIVKVALRGAALGEVDQVTGRPQAESRLIEVLTKKPLRPTEEELVLNPRARSARLRAARRL